MNGNYLTQLTQIIDKSVAVYGDIVGTHVKTYMDAGEQDELVFHPENYKKKEIKIKIK